MPNIPEQMEPETLRLLYALLAADEKLPRHDRGNFLYVERWTRKYNVMPRARAEEVLKTGSLGLPEGREPIDSIAEIPPEYDRDLVRHEGLEHGYIEIASIDLDALRIFEFIEFKEDRQHFSLTPKIKTLKSVLDPLNSENELAPYNDQDQPWFSKVPDIVSSAGDDTEWEPTIVMLTAVRTERDMVLRRMEPFEGSSGIIKITSGPDTYYGGLLAQHRIALVMSEPGAIGRAASILTTYEAIRRWNPKAVMAVGFSFGMNPHKHKIADILISKTVTNYESQRVEDDLVIPRGTTVEAGQHLLNRFLNVDGWEFRRPDGSSVSTKAGQILSGEKLVDSLNFKLGLLARYPEALGGEMEGAGLYAAAERAKVEWIIVKAICDWGDGNKHKQYQPLAAAAAVSLFEHVLKDPDALSGLRRPLESTGGREGLVAPNPKAVIASGDRSVAVGGTLNNSMINTGDEKINRRN
jgi:nucleoside phosphorylase